nr:PREDICTED: transcription factor BTF3-like [Equus przewalskii]
MRRTGAPAQADSRGRGRARGGCPGGEATPSLPPPTRSVSHSASL